MININVLRICSRYAMLQTMLHITMLQTTMLETTMLQTM
jgi:hypothetical protein